MELEKQIIKAAEEKKGFDIEVLEIKELTSIADKFIIIQGNSNRHIKTIAKEITSVLKKQDIYAISVEGIHSVDTGWILIDYGNIVVHIFDEESRKKFDIETFWKEEMKKQNIKNRK